MLHFSQHMANILMLQFAVCKDELLHLLHSVVDSMGPRIANHAVDIKVFVCACLISTCHGTLIVGSVR